jgi:hypothetical protein
MSEGPCRYRPQPEPGFVLQKDTSKFRVQFNPGCIFKNFEETHSSWHYTSQTFEGRVYEYAARGGGKCNLFQEYRQDKYVEFRAQCRSSSGVRWKVTSVPVGPGMKNVEYEGGCYYNVQCCCKQACKDSATPTTAENVHQMYLVSWTPTVCKCK